MLKNLLGQIDFINKIISDHESDLLEHNSPTDKISRIFVKKSQILMELENSSINRDSFNSIDKIQEDFSINGIFCLDSRLYLVFDDLKEKPRKEPYAFPIEYLYSFIFVLQELLCTCPALEYEVAQNYLKIYLDPPNISSDSFMSINNKLNQVGILELNPQRPYVLYTKDWEDDVHE